LLSLSEDNTTITQDHVLTAQDITLGLSEDASTVTETNFNLTVQDITLGLTEDNTTITQNHVLASQDMLLSLGEDNTTISTSATNYDLIVQDISLSLRTDKTYAYDGTPPVQRDYYIDSDANIYWVISESVGLVERV
jgi:hypothetical protein